MRTVRHAFCLRHYDWKKLLHYGGVRLLRTRDHHNIFLCHRSALYIEIVDLVVFEVTPSETRFRTYFDISIALFYWYQSLNDVELELPISRYVLKHLEKLGDLLNWQHFVKILVFRRMILTISVSTPTLEKLFSTLERKTYSCIRSTMSQD